MMTETPLPSLLANGSTKLETNGKITELIMSSFKGIVTLPNKHKSNLKAKKLFWNVNILMRVSE